MTTLGIMRDVQEIMKLLRRAGVTYPDYVEKYKPHGVLTAIVGAIVTTAPNAGRAYVETRSVPESQSEHTYQAWLRKEREGEAGAIYRLDEVLDLTEHVTLEPDEIFAIIQAEYVKAKERLGGESR